MRDLGPVTARPIPPVLAIGIALMSSGCGLFAGLADGGTTADEASLGALDDEVVEEITDTAAVERVDARFDEQGALMHVELQHLDGRSIPEDVREAARARFPGGRLVTYGTALTHGETSLYHVHLRTGDGRQCTLAAEGDGLVAYVDCVVPATALPPAVAVALTRVSEGEGETLKVVRRETTMSATFLVEHRITQRTHLIELTNEGDVVEHDVLLPATMRVPYRGAALRAVVPEEVRSAYRPAREPRRRPEPPAEEDPQDP